MYIGELCKRTGSTARAIHHYENIGLIPKPTRSGKYRIYSENYVAMVNIIKKAQSLGFKLSELTTLIETKARTRHFPLGIAETMIQEKRLEIQRQIQTMQQQDRELAELHVELLEIV